MCGKYTELHDAYKSVTESFIHAGVENNTKVEIVWVNTEKIKNDKQAHKAFDNIDAVYKAADNISIDYGVLEKASNVKVIPAEFGWSDLGTWTSLAYHLECDSEGNGVVSADLVATDSKGNIVVAPEGKIVAIKGMDNFIVVDTKDALLICPKSDEQWVKKLVGDLPSDHI